MIRRLCVVLALLAPYVAKSQATGGARIRVLPPDSVPWRPIIQYVVASLAGDIARAAHDTTPQAWQISLPDSSAAWTQLRTHLYTALRARAPREAEVDTDELTIGPMRMSADTAYVHVVRTHTRACTAGVGRTGYGNVEDVYVVRLQERFWSSARSPRVVHGDRAGCAPL